MVFSKTHVVMLSDEQIRAIRILTEARVQELALIGENPELIAIYAGVLQQTSNKV